MAPFDLIMSFLSDEELRLLIEHARTVSPEQQAEAAERQKLYREKLEQARVDGLAPVSAEVQQLIVSLEQVTLEPFKSSPEIGEALWEVYGTEAFYEAWKEQAPDDSERIRFLQLAFKAF